MSKARFLLTVAIFALSLIGCKGKEPEPAATNAFLGSWSVDYDRTMAAIADTPGQTPETVEVMGLFIKKIAADARISITPTDIVYSIGNDTYPSPYTVTASDATTLATKSQQDGQEVTVTFTLLDNSNMTLKSTVSSDMDRYVWKKSDQ